MTDAPHFQDVDAAHGYALSRLVHVQPPADDDPEEGEAGADIPEGQELLPGGVEAPPPLHVYLPPDEEGGPPPSDLPDDLSEDGMPEETDPSDEIHMGQGDKLGLLFALFVDGVQLHQHGRATTTVISLKCLDLPGFLANTALASFNLAFISGPKEPTNLTGVMRLILGQFKQHEPVGGVTDGHPTVHGCGIRVWDPYRQKIREVFPIMFYAVADTPARKCWLLTTSHNSRSGCDKCGIRACRELPGGDDAGYQAFSGYGCMTPAVVYEPQEQVRMPWPGHVG